MIKIGIDAMGGDFAPEVAIEGAIMSLKHIANDSRIVLFGDQNRISELLAKHGCPTSNFDIVPTTETIEMGDHPAKAFVAKKDSSITVGFRYLSEGKIDGFASAGSTGAMMVGSMQVIKPI
jgi:glycerol-3-phosphate acyltransferase PlsX